MELTKFCERFEKNAKHEKIPGDHHILVLPLPLPFLLYSLLFLLPQLPYFFFQAYFFMKEVFFSMIAWFKDI